MKELQNLKCRAIAVKIHEMAIDINVKDVLFKQVLHYNVRQSDLGYSDFLGVQHRDIELPPGEWEILGRANELKYGQVDKIFEDERTIPLMDAWSEYCASNSITTEIILIQT